MMLPAPAISTLTSRGDFVEVFIYGIVFLVLIMLLFVVARWLKLSIGSKLRNEVLPLGMTGEDLDRLKKKGGLTPEEAKAVKQALGRRFLERAKAEEEARTGPREAAVLLALEEERLLKEKGLVRAPDAASSVEPHAPEPPPAVRPPLQRAAEQPVADALPAHLARLAQKTDVELEELHRAGFLSDEELEALRRRAGGRA